MLRFECRPFLFFLSFLGVLMPAAARAQDAQAHQAAGAETLDTEHIFGFAEGSDIGPRGEWEFESFTGGGFGARAGNVDVGNDTSLRYTLTDELRLSAGGLLDYFGNRNVPGAAGRSEPSFGGVIAEARWNILNWRTAPFGMTLSLDPEWRRAGPAAGKPNDSYSAAAALLVDKELIPEKFFMAINLIYSAFFLPLKGGLEHDDSFTIIASGSYALGPNIFFGAEIRHENLAQNGNLNAHALFVGPQLYARLGATLSVTLAFAAQLPDFAARALDLKNFDRHQIGLRLAYSF